MGGTPQMAGGVWQDGIPPRARAARRVVPRTLLCAAALAGGAAIATYLVIALSRLTYPFPLEWLESNSLIEVHRILAGRQLYPAPTISYVPDGYPPLYFVLGCIGQIGRCVVRAAAAGVGGIVAGLLRAAGSVDPARDRERLRWHRGRRAAGRDLSSPPDLVRCGPGGLSFPRRSASLPSTQHAGCNAPAEQSLLGCCSRRRSSPSRPGSPRGRRARGPGIWIAPAAGVAGCADRAAVLAVSTAVLGLASHRVGTCTTCSCRSSEHKLNHPSSSAGSGPDRCCRHAGSHAVRRFWEPGRPTGCCWPAAPRCSPRVPRRWCTGAASSNDMLPAYLAVALLAGFGMGRERGKRIAPRGWRKPAEVSDGRPVPLRWAALVATMLVMAQTVLLLGSFIVARRCQGAPTGRLASSSWRACANSAARSGLLRPWSRPSGRTAARRAPGRGRRHSARAGLRACQLRAKCRPCGNRLALQRVHH